MNRRSVLAATGTALGASLGGCYQGSAEEDLVANCNQGGTGPGGGDHHLFLVNLDDETRRVCLDAVDGATGERVLGGAYDVADERGGEFRDVAEWERTYEVTVTLASGLSETFDWNIERCGRQEAPNGSRNASVRIEPNGERLTFVADRCDELHAGTEAPTGPAEQFAVDESG